MTGSFFYCRVASYVGPGELRVAHAAFVWRLALFKLRGSVGKEAPQGSGLGASSRRIRIWHSSGNLHEQSSHVGPMRRPLVCSNVTMADANFSFSLSLSLFAVASRGSSLSKATKKVPTDIQGHQYTNFAGEAP